MSAVALQQKLNALVRILTVFLQNNISIIKLNIGSACAKIINWCQYPTSSLISIYGFNSILVAERIESMM